MVLLYHHFIVLTRKGPSIVIAYCPCTEHNIIGGMKECMKVQKLAVETGYWINYRFNPTLAHEGKNPFSLDSRPPTKEPHEYLVTQGRFLALEREQPEQAKGYLLLYTCCLQNQLCKLFWQQT